MRQASCRGEIKRVFSQSGLACWSICGGQRRGEPFIIRGADDPGPTSGNY